MKKVLFVRDSHFGVRRVKHAVHIRGLLHRISKLVFMCSAVGSFPGLQLHNFVKLNLCFSEYETCFGT